MFLTLRPNLLLLLNYSTMTHTKTGRRKWKVLLLIACCCFAGIQCIRPRIDHPPVTEDISVPPDVKAILRKACYDCHSNETRLACFDQVSPAIWLVARHVKAGRQALNFSEWDRLGKDQQKGKLFESLNQAMFNTMPVPQYAMLHPAARLTGKDIAVLKNYLSAQFIAGKQAGAKPAAAGRQLASWSSAGAAQQVQPAPNGIAYIPGYKNWEAISTTDRLDNGTMRVIMGNDVAMKAIREAHINPCPDGTAFAKVAWDEVTDTAGNVHPGAFKQVEFMIKDSRKYAATDGWGWARWKGTDLKPYGNNAMFTMECTGCHQPMRNNDFVFTMPVNLSTK